MVLKLNSRMTNKKMEETEIRRAENHDTSSLSHTPFFWIVNNIYFYLCVCIWFDTISCYFIVCFLYVQI